MASSSTQRAHGVQAGMPAPWVSEIVRQFEVAPSLLQDATNLFVKQLREGLAQDGTSLLQVPSYVTKLPDGSEKGTCLAIDLGGTNLRVCSVELRGDSTYSVAKTKAAIPVPLMAAPSYKNLFRFIAQHVEEFLLGRQPDGVEEWHWPERVQEWRNLLEAQDVTGELRRTHAHPLGFTFSFTFDQHAIDRGTLLHWTKAFTIKDAVGRDPCAMLQEALDEQRLPLVVTALANDTVGTLAARAYSAGSLHMRRCNGAKTGPSGGTLLGAIFGTGTNGAYMERLESITKLHSHEQFADPERRRGQFQALNTEWGGFDGKLEVLPVTPYDAALDRESANPDDQHFEKRISGMYLGEILRLVLVERCGPGGELGGLGVPPTSRLFVPYAIDSPFLSALVSDRTAGLDSARGEIQSVLGVSDVTVADAEAIWAVAEAIGRRAARLSAIAVAGIVMQSGRASQRSQVMASAAWGALPSFGLFRAALLSIVRRLASWLGFAPIGRPTVPSPSPHARDNGGSHQGQEGGGAGGEIDIGVDGSLFEHFPRFEDNMRAALREIPAIGPGVERNIRMGTAKDGSSVGAALIAWTVGQSRWAISPSITNTY